MVDLLIFFNPRDANLNWAWGPDVILVINCLYIISDWIKTHATHQISFLCIYFILSNNVIGLYSYFYFFDWFIMSLRVIISLLPMIPYHQDWNILRISWINKMIWSNHQTSSVTFVMFISCAQYLHTQH